MSRDRSRKPSNGLATLSPPSINSALANMLTSRTDIFGTRINEAMERMFAPLKRPAVTWPPEHSAWFKLASPETLRIPSLALIQNNDAFGALARAAAAALDKGNLEWSPLGESLARAFKGPSRGDNDEGPGRPKWQFPAPPSPGEVWALEARTYAIELARWNRETAELNKHDAFPTSATADWRDVVDPDCGDPATQADIVPALPTSAPVPKRTGGPRSLMKFVDAEFDQRVAAGPLRQTLKAESKSLHKWLATNPEALRAGIKIPKAESIANHIRQKYAGSTPRKRP